MAKSKQLPGQQDLFDEIGITPQNDSKRQKKDINLTEKDINFICENILKPVIQQIAQSVSSAEEKQNELTNKMFDAVGNAILDIRYETMRDRRFYKAMFTQLLLKNTMLTPAAYDEFYKNWCNEFDKLNKENKNNE